MIIKISCDVLMYKYFEIKPISGTIFKAKRYSIIDKIFGYKRSKHFMLLENYHFNLPGFVCVKVPKGTLFQYTPWGALVSEFEVL